MFPLPGHKGPLVCATHDKRSHFTHARSAKFGLGYKEKKLAAHAHSPAHVTLCVKKNTNTSIREHDRSLTIDMDWEKKKVAAEVPRKMDHLLTNIINYFCRAVAPTFVDHRSKLSILIK